MASSKIQDEAEVVRWFEEGRTYRWMCEEYERKYNLRVVPSMFGNFRRRKGLDRRIVRDDDLIPWAVKEEHRWAYPLALLRMEARRRAGQPLTDSDALRLAGVHKRLRDGDLVIDYDPDTEEGFHYVKRRPGVDLDLIREPGFKSTMRPAADVLDRRVAPMPLPKRPRRVQLAKLLADVQKAYVGLETHETVEALAHAAGVVDVLDWLRGADPTPELDALLNVAGWSE